MSVTGEGDPKSLVGKRRSPWCGRSSPLQDPDDLGRCGCGTAALLPPEGTASDAISVASETGRLMVLPAPAEPWRWKAKQVRPHRPSSPTTCTKLVAGALAVLGLHPFPCPPLPGRSSAVCAPLAAELGTAAWWCLPLLRPSVVVGLRSQRLGLLSPFAPTPGLLPATLAHRQWYLRLAPPQLLLTNNPFPSVYRVAMAAVVPLVSALAPRSPRSSHAGMIVCCPRSTSGRTAARPPAVAEGESAVARGAILVAWLPGWLSLLVDQVNIVDCVTRRPPC